MSTSRTKTMSSTDLPVTLKDIEEAAKLIAGKVVRTPSALSRTFSEITGAQVVLKFENLQYTASFKDRGAYVKLSSLSPEERKRGVIAVSAGNHAQGVAYHAQNLGIPATIVMPTTAPSVKVRNTERFGARVMLCGKGIDEAAVAAREIQVKENLTFIHPYDDPKTIAGQGTVGLELLADHPEIETILVPVGGGGLVSGIAIAAKAIKPGVEIVGVEVERYPSYFRALRGLEPRFGSRTIAEGIAVKTIGKLNLPIVRALVDDIVLVSEEAVEEAVVLLLEIEKTVAEGAGAATLAALLANRERFAGRRVGIIVSGGNIDPRILASVITLGLVRTGRLVQMRIEIPDRPGVLAKIARIIADTGANIIEVHHERAFSGLPVLSADLIIACETRDKEHVKQIVAAIAAAGYAPEVVSGAKDFAEPDPLAGPRPVPPPTD